MSRIDLRKTLLPGLAITFFTICYLTLIVPFANYMQSKPFAEKIGVVPTVAAMKFFSADQQQLSAEALVLKVLIYFGGLMEEGAGELEMAPDYPAMSRMLHGAAKLDPYNMDTYYFAQSILVWDVGQIELANNLLEYGMKYRDWDWTLPYYVGFNNAYFLKDYSEAGKYYRIAGDLSGSSLFGKLAGRYLHESGQTALAITYLEMMVEGAKNPAIRESLNIRLQSLQAVYLIEKAVNEFKRVTGRLPVSFDDLIGGGFLQQVPVDPYGGIFYIDGDGKVSTTSRFAFKHKQDDVQ